VTICFRETSTWQWSYFGSPPFGRKSIMQRFIFSLFVASCAMQNGWARETAQLIFSDQFANIGADGLPDGWEVWSGKNMTQLVEPNNQITRSGGHSMRVSGNGNYHTKGALTKTLTDLSTGAYYKVVVQYTTRDLAGGINSRVFPVLKWAVKQWQTLEPVAIDNGWLRAEGIHQLSEDAQGSLKVELFSGWIPDGSVYWDSVEVYHCQGSSDRFAS